MSGDERRISLDPDRAHARRGAEVALALVHWQSESRSRIVWGRRGVVAAGLGVARVEVDPDFRAEVCGRLALDILTIRSETPAAAVLSAPLQCTEASKVKSCSN